MPRRTVEEETCEENGPPVTAVGPKGPRDSERLTRRNRFSIHPIMLCMKTETLIVIFPALNSRFAARAVFLGRGRGQTRLARTGERRLPFRSLSQLPRENQQDRSPRHGCLTGASVPPTDRPIYPRGLEQPDRRHSPKRSRAYARPVST